MVDFNDRRLTESQKNPAYVRPDIQHAVNQHLESGSERRVSLSFNGDRDENGAQTRYRQSGYLRADESGSPALYPNSRSTKGRSVALADLASIDASRKSRNGTRNEYWSRWGGTQSLPGK